MNNKGNDQYIRIKYSPFLIIKYYASCCVRYSWVSCLLYTVLSCIVDPADFLTPHLLAGVPIILMAGLFIFATVAIIGLVPCFLLLHLGERHQPLPLSAYAVTGLAVGLIYSFLFSVFGPNLIDIAPENSLASHFIFPTAGVFGWIHFHKLLDHSG